MKREQCWVKVERSGDGERELAVENWAQWEKHPEEELSNGYWHYQIRSSDGYTKLELVIRVQPGWMPKAIDLSLWTYLPDDPEVDRRMDFTTALGAHEFMIAHGPSWLTRPGGAFWAALEDKFKEWDARARSDYRRDLGNASAVKPPGLVGVAPGHLKLNTLQLDNAFRIVGVNDNLVIVNAPTMELALEKYRAEVDMIVSRINGDVNESGPIGVKKGIAPVYGVQLVEHLGQLTILME